MSHNPKDPDIEIRKCSKDRAVGITKVYINGNMVSEMRGMMLSAPTAERVKSLLWIAFREGYDAATVARAQHRHSLPDLSVTWPDWETGESKGVHFYPEFRHDFELLVAMGQTAHSPYGQGVVPGKRLIGLMRSFNPEADCCYSASQIHDEFLIARIPVYEPH